MDARGWKLDAGGWMLESYSYCYYLTLSPKEGINMDKKELAVQYKHSGYNCAQAVIAAYADELGVDLVTARALGAGFGAGMGTMGATCGALCGAQTVLGLMNKGSVVMGAARKLYNGFFDRCGATICAELKGITTGRTLCSCDNCVANAVAVLEELL